MKKLIIIIVILAIILIGMIVCKNVIIKTNHIDIQEIEKVENYIQQMYMWKEVTGEALPCFEDINQANEDWIWQVVKKNLEEYEVSYEKIQEKAKELWGENFKKEFPKEGTEYLTYREENNLYYAEEIALDQQDDVFLLNKIDKIENGYEVEIIEYLEDYSQELETNQIIIKNIKGEEVFRVGMQEENQIKEKIKNSVNRLNQKKLILKLENQKLQLEKVRE